jgi:hypothetical protein
VSIGFCHPIGLQHFVDWVGVIGIAVWKGEKLGDWGNCNRVSVAEFGWGEEQKGKSDI